MPANKKHLNPTFHQRFAKITAGFVGGFILTTVLFFTAAIFTDHRIVFLILKFAGFIVWCVFMILPFLFRNGWKAWGYYLLFIGLFLLILYYSNSYSPQLFNVL